MVAGSRRGRWGGATMAAYRPGVQLPCEGCRVPQRVAWWGAGSSVPGGEGKAATRSDTLDTGRGRWWGFSGGAVAGKHDCAADAVRHLDSSLFRKYVCNM